MCMYVYMCVCICVCICVHVYMCVLLSFFVFLILEGLFCFNMPVCFLKKEGRRRGVGWVGGGEDHGRDDGGEL